MQKPDFSLYSLALIKDGKIIFSSNESGLKPLLECIKQYKGKVNGCILYDKVIGLAAAKLVVYSEMISSIFTATASKKAVDYLSKNNVDIHADKVVENILNKEGSGICPMELKVQKEDDDFFRILGKH